MKVVIKIGSSSLIKNSKVDEKKIEKLSEIISFYQENINFIIVSSGSVAVGREILGLNKTNLSIREKQALSSIGQPDLMREYQKKFEKKNILIGQILLTKAELHDRKRYLNARETIEELLKYRVIPIINENDTVSNEEIKIGDNDTLSAIVAAAINADKLIILSDIDGLYDKNPTKYKDAKLIPEVYKITDKIKKNAGGAGSDFGTGGMATKIQAAQIAMDFGIEMSIIDGEKLEGISEILEGKKVGTVFYPYKKEKEKKIWIAYGRKEKGIIYIDEGAKKALENGKSLLAMGIKKIEGKFKIGETLKICDLKGNEIARGLVNYNYKELEKIMGQKSSEIEKKLGYKYQDEIIHRNNMLITLSNKA